jgi:hypothetical protein
MPAAPPAPLQGKVDLYSGVIVDPTSLPAAPEEFAPALAESLAAWGAAGKRGVWIKVPKERAALVPVCVDQVRREGDTLRLLFLITTFFSVPCD